MEELGIAKAQLEIEVDKLERDLAFERNRLDDKENELKERLKELNEMKLKTAEINGNSAAAGDDLIEVNAGGQIVAAKRSTFTQLKGTRLEALLSGRWDKTLQRDGNGRIFLDVDPVGFRAIVDHLAEMAISSEDHPPALPNADEDHQHILQHQLELFGLWDNTVEFPDSNIVEDEQHVMVLHAWLEMDGSDGEFSLLYRSSRDGSDASDFHSKCDDHGCTLTILETTEGFILGGYSNTPWNSSGDGAKSNKAFLFVLSGSDITFPWKLLLKDANDDQAVRNAPSFGPVFGNGTDLYVDGSGLGLKFGHSYESGPPGQLATKSDGSSAVLGIKEMEVFQVTTASQVPCATEKRRKTQRQIPEVNLVSIFSERINEAINARQESLLQAELEILHLEDSFKDEQHFVAAFASGDEKDVVALNVSGTAMVAKRSTLQAVADSVLARQFDDSKWTEQGDDARRVKDWTPDEVGAWVQNIHGIRDDVVEIFKENAITGYELLALHDNGLVMLGITRPGTVCVIMKEIQKLEKAGQDMTTLIEHSPYCFAKILDFLRRKELHSRGLAEAPPLPTVCDFQRSRFEKVVRYYFPGDSAQLLLG